MVETVTCRTLRRHLAEYLDGEAATGLCAAIEKHLQECDACHVIVHTTQRTVSLYRRLPRPIFFAREIKRALCSRHFSSFRTDPTQNWIVVNIRHVTPP